ncbi:MAG: hypothetical protein A2X23_07130 [Chloroflexi bacterium GWC2_73_18]|nr:MAG: hypothetical protein A2X23_07130 [Chloroflexi bacterium GWC2_73_18]
MNDAAPARLAPPGPSFLREQAVRLRAADGGERTIRLGLGRPATTDDGWWLALAWARDDEGIVSCLDVAPPAGPPPDPPLLVMGPAFGGALSGLVAEREGRQALRLRLPPPADPDRPWARPLILQIAVAWEPLRAVTMRPTELAVAVLTAFRRAVESAGRSG